MALRGGALALLVLALASTAYGQATTPLQALQQLQYTDPVTAEAATFNYFYAAVARAGLNKKFSITGGPIRDVPNSKHPMSKIRLLATVFVPTDAAIIARYPDLAILAQDDVVNWVSYHIVPFFFPTNTALVVADQKLSGARTTFPTFPVPMDSPTLGPSITLQGQNNTSEDPAGVIDAILRGFADQSFASVLDYENPTFFPDGTDATTAQVVFYPLNATLEFPRNNIYNAIEAMGGEFTDILDLVDFANFTDMLKNDHAPAATYFIPPNSAFDELFTAVNTTLEMFLSDPANIPDAQALLSYHFIPGKALVYNNFIKVPAKTKFNKYMSGLAGAYIYTGNKKVSGVTHLLVQDAPKNPGFVSEAKITGIKAGATVGIVVTKVLIPPV